MSVEVPYEVVRTATMERQLRNEVFYLRDVSGSAAPALGLLDRLEQASGQLSQFPRMGVVPRTPSLARRGYRMLVIERYLLFYKVDDAAHRVILHGIFHQRQEYEGLL